MTARRSKRRLSEVKNTINHDNIATYYKRMNRKKSVPSFRKQIVVQEKNEGLPSFLTVKNFFASLGIKQ